VQVTVLLEPPRCVSERGARDRGAGATGPELAREQPGAHEAERIREQEQQVVAQHGGRHAAPDRAGRRVAGQRLRDREAVLHRPEGVGLEVVERLVPKRVTAPSDLPGLHQRIADVARHVAGHVQRQRPVHRQREQHREQHGQPELALGQGRGAIDARHCCKPATPNAHPRAFRAP
jgi:hypothetical protein